MEKIIYVMVKQNGIWKQFHRLIQIIIIIMIHPLFPVQNQHLFWIDRRRKWVSKVILGEKVRNSLIQSFLPISRDHQSLLRIFECMLHTYTLFFAIDYLKASVS